METRDHSATLTVAAVYRDVPGFDGYLVGPADLAQLRAGLDLAGGYARAADGVSHDATLVGLFGIVNILTLSTVERRRGIGLLRAVGMDDGR